MAKEGGRMIGEMVAITRIVVLRDDYPFKDAMVRVNNTLLVHPKREEFARRRHPKATVEYAAGFPPPRTPLPIGKE
jgi:hypothetical protein